MARYEAHSANALAVEVTTNTPAGGDAGHGGVTVLVLEDLASTSWSIEVMNEEGVSSVCSDPCRLTLIFRGDTECETLIKCLDFAVKHLRKRQRANRAGT